MGYFYLFLNYFLHTTYASASFVILALAFLYGLRIKDADIRIYVFILALIKPLHTIAHKVDASPGNTFSSGISFWHPHLFFHGLLEPRFADHIDFTAFNWSLFISLFVGIAVIASYRFFHMYVFFKRMCMGKSCAYDAGGAIDALLHRYVPAMGIAKPSICFVDHMKFLSFTFGIKKAKIVINKRLFHLLDDGQKETLILHELGHIKRRDHWFNLLHILLLDLCFYNPLSHYAYHCIKHEQEKDCDRLIVKYSDKSPQEVARDILNMTLKIKSVQPAMTDKVPASASAFTLQKRLGANIFKRRVYSIIRLKENKARASKATRIILCTLLTIIMFF
jgi:Zn-dependent protease with chaperone function